MYSLTSQFKHLDLSAPAIMGILNATPNSFYNKGQGSDLDSLLRNAEKMLNDGAAILDIGGASTKPGQPIIDPAIEMDRVLPVIAAICKRFPSAWLSVDTYNASVAMAAVNAGADIVNDISAGSIDGNMMSAVADSKAVYVAMHMQGVPETMQKNPEYDNVTDEVYTYLENAIGDAAQAGIAQTIIDPGFGFGKTVAHNFALLRNLSVFASLGKPILAGLSRKSLICRSLGVTPEHALNGTTALNMVALQNGANILRVHDVKEAMETIKLYAHLK